MRNEDRLNFFEDALTRLRTGESLQAVINSLPQDAELIELVRTAALIKFPEEKLYSVNAAAQSRSKQAFLQAALDQDSKNNPHGIIGWLQGLRLAARLTLVIAVLLFSLTITGIVSAKALPGQPLYSVKRLVEQTQLALTRDSLGRLQFEEVLDSRRVYEVIRLLDSGRMQDVVFAGWMHQNPDGSWQVQGIPVVLDEQSPMWNPMLNGAYVEINGKLSPEGVIVRNVELRLFKLHGTLQLVGTDTWQINGIPLKISPQTQTQLLISNGLVVDVTAIRLSEDQYLALLINAAGPDKSIPEDQSQPINSPTSTELPTATITPSATNTMIPTEIEVTASLTVTDDEVSELEAGTVTETDEHEEESEKPQVTPTQTQTEESSHETTPTKTVEPDHD